ncbi:MAG: hypothetical protein ACYC1C_03190, partial [Chloroflexota bacterium]
GRQTWDPQARQKIYAEFQDLFQAEAPAVFLYYPAYHYALSNEVKGAEFDALLDPTGRFRTLNQWYVREKRVFFQP